jgi:lipopolysaccharide transport system ATP-binding protein
MSDVAVRAENLSKLYRIGERDRYSTLRDTIMNFVRRPLARFSDNGNGVSSSSLAESTIWALKDVSFEVKRGEVVGIIGRNGAGKSTLLKILSRITQPTEGEARIYGRVGSLLEVGTGFHPELTGRENIYLNGAILGMKKAEIDRKFDEIVAFAEVEKFLDTPIKHYSSGMYMRLAFAVAAHLEPEILLVDEVLAVGDAAFQKKCMGKMDEVAKEGKTILFVSHNMGSVNQLCARTLWLDSGQIAKMDSTHEVIHDYLSSHASATGTWTNSVAHETELGIRLLSASIVTKEGNQTPVVRFDEGFSLDLCYEVRDFIRSPWTLVFRVSNASGTAVFTSWDIDSATQDKPRETGLYRAVCYVPGKLLRPGVYSVSLGICFTNTKMMMSSFREHLFHFEVSSVGYPMNINRGGLITPVLRWSVERRSN